MIADIIKLVMTDTWQQLSNQLNIYDRNEYVRYIDPVLMADEESIRCFVYER